MGGIAPHLRRRIERLEKALARVPASISLEEEARREARRLELASAALEGLEPGHLTEEERPIFEKILLFAPVFKELVDEGIIDANGAPCGASGEDGEFEGSHDVVGEANGQNGTRA